MGEVIGKLISCDRCGEICFRARIEQCELDGGFTRYDKYEADPESWGWHSETGKLCSKCNDEYNNLLKIFMAQSKKNGED